MKKPLYILYIFCLLLFACSENKNDEDQIKIIPISHSTLIIEYENEVIYIDPVGDENTFKDQKSPTLVLITDIHSDHLSIETLLNTVKPETKIISPNAVVKKIDRTIERKIISLNNNKSTVISKIKVEAIPMYHLREEAKAFHPKGRGNGYVLTLGKKRIYISGDTEDIPEMRTLKDIDIAFVCMNLPWTMSVEKAADAVLDFQPKEVYPYHYKGTNGISDIKQFKALIHKENNTIKVHLKDWY